MSRTDTVSLGEAARMLGVSVDTLRRWDRSDKIRTTRDSGNRRRIPTKEVERLRNAPARHATGDSLSARNRLPGTVRSIEQDGVMALIEIEIDGGHLVTSAVTRDSIEELELVPGTRVRAAVKASSVMIICGS